MEKWDGKMGWRKGVEKGGGERGWRKGGVVKAEVKGGEGVKGWEIGWKKKKNNGKSRK